MSSIFERDNRRSPHSPRSGRHRTTIALVLPLLLISCAGEGLLLKHKERSTDSDTGRDQCPDDALKTEPGVCGCGVQDVDIDRDGVMDCLAAPGWTDLLRFLVPSDGSHGLGDTGLEFNDTRDQGSKIVYFDSVSGDNATAGVYWWNGENIVDADGSTSNPDNDELYGKDPLSPNEAAIKPFSQFLSEGDDRLRTQAGAGPNNWRFSGVAGGYPDWFLFRRGQIHDTFDRMLTGGRSEEEPMVVSAYGPMGDGRAIMAPTGVNPFSGHNWDISPNWLHHVLSSLEIRALYGYNNTDSADSFAGGPVTAFIEDCYWPGLNDNLIAYPPQKTTIRRSIFAHAWREGAGNQGYYSAGSANQVLVDEVIFYRNGFKSDPLTDPDPLREVVGRNIFEGGGAKMGHVFRNIISADGGSGGPQMRFGGLMEESLIIEGYWYASTDSGTPDNPWLAAEGQTGQSAWIRNNVQLVFSYPTVGDPDTDGLSDPRAHPGWGFSLQGATFGAVVEDNIISGAMLENDLDGTAGGHGFNLVVNPIVYQDGVTYAQRNNTLRGNIVYRVAWGLGIEGDATGASELTVEDNVFVAPTPVMSTAVNLTTENQIALSNNRFYASGALADEPWIDEGNDVAEMEAAEEREAWPDPDRTLRRYVEEALGLTLLDWSDDPFLDPVAAQTRIDAGEAYDPTGLKTFMAVAVHMRKGGAYPIPDSGKPSLLADYPWDRRFTARAVVNWIREGFGLSGLK